MLAFALNVLKLYYLGQTNLIILSFLFLTTLLPLWLLYYLYYIVVLVQKDLKIKANITNLSHCLGFSMNSVSIFLVSFTSFYLPSSCFGRTDGRVANRLKQARDSYPTLLRKDAHGLI